MIRIPYVFYMAKRRLYVLPQMTIRTPTKVAREPRGHTARPDRLMEKLPGKPLDWNRANEEKRARVLEQVADVYSVSGTRKAPNSANGLPLSTLRGWQLCTSAMLRNAREEIGTVLNA